MQNLLTKVHAQVDTAVANPVSRFDSTTTLAQIFGLVINVVIGIGIALTIVYLALGGIKYVTAQGDPKATEEAKTALTNAIIGFVIVVGAITIRFVVGNILGADNTSIGGVTPDSI